MKLFMSPTSPYARKARIIIHELDLGRMIEEVVVDLAERTELRKINPLGKIPALQLKDGSVLLDSPVICEYLSDLGGGKFFPGRSIWGEAPGRWRALTLQALGDGLSDAAVARVYESRRPAEFQSQETIEKYLTAMGLTLDALERASARFAETPTIGEIAVGCALGFLDLRLGELKWRDTRPALSAWYEKFANYPSMQATKPPVAQP